VRTLAVAGLREASAKRTKAQYPFAKLFVDNAVTVGPDVPYPAWQQKRGLRVWAFCAQRAREEWTYRALPAMPDGSIGSEFGWVEPASLDLFETKRQHFLAEEQRRREAERQREEARQAKERLAAMENLVAAKLESLRAAHAFKVLLEGVRSELRELRVDQKESRAAFLRARRAASGTTALQPILDALTLTLTSHEAKSWVSRKIEIWSGRFSEVARKRHEEALAQIDRNIRENRDHGVRIGREFLRAQEALEREKRGGRRPDPAAAEGSANPLSRSAPLVEVEGKP
jgi:hypothetical protein